MNKKLIIFLLGCFVAIGSISTGIYYSKTDKNRYNLSPDLSKKVIESASIASSSEEITSVDDVVKYADIAVRGKVLSDPIVKDEIIGKDFVDQNGEPKYSKNYYYQVEVEDVLFGELTAKTIYLVQCYETKVSKNKEYIMLLRYDNSPDYRTIEDNKENIFWSASWEDGFFEVKKNDNKKTEVTEAMSNQLSIAKYDGIDIKILKEDLKNSAKKAKKLKE